MKKIGTIVLFFLYCYSYSGNLGQYYPFPEQEDVVEIFLSSKETWAVTKTNVMLEVKGFFSSKYKSSDTIVSAFNDGDKIWLGTNTGLYKFDTRTHTVTPLPLPGANKPCVVDIFSDKQTKVWICTKDNGIFATTESGEIELQTSKKGIVSGDVLTTGTIGLVGENGFHYFLKSYWHTITYATYSELNDNDELLDMFVDHSGYFWVVNRQQTNIFELQSSVGRPDTLLLKNKFVNNGIQIYNFVNIPDLGILFTTSKGLFFNYRAVNLNPLLEFSDMPGDTNITELLETDITANFAHETGYRRAELIKYDEAGKKVWFVNQNGALGVPIKDLKKLLVN